MALQARSEITRITLGLGHNDLRYKQAMTRNDIKDMDQLSVSEHDSRGQSI